MKMNRKTTQVWIAVLIGAVMMNGFISCGGKNSSRVKTNEKGEIEEIVVAR